MKLSNKVAWVTGGGRGIGRSIALRLAQEGATVAISARGADAINQTAQDIQSTGGKALAIPADISKVDDVQIAAATIREALGTVDILINNAAIVDPVGHIKDIDPMAWEQTQRVNVLGAYYTIHQVLPAMLAQDYGRIVGITSSAATGDGIPRFNAYSTSKAALDMMTRNAALDLAGSGVTINNLSPGAVDTEMQVAIRKIPTERGGVVIDQFKARYAEGQLNTPEHSARHVLALLLSEMSGAILHVREFPAELQALLETVED